MISFKVFDNNLVYLNDEIVNFIKSREDVFIEYTYYNNDIDSVNKNLECLEGKQSSFHLNSKFVNCIEFSEENLKKELDVANLYKATKLIIHPEKNHAPKKLGYQYNILDLVVERLKYITSFLNKDQIIYIENVRFELDFYKKLFPLIKENNITNLGFCFDIGHAKTFSLYSFDEWFEFLEYLDSIDIDIYFHIHANEGLNDEHKPYSSYEDISVLNDEYFSNNMMKDLGKLFKRFNKKWFSLELMPKDIIKEIEFLEKNKIYN
jgi:sugar phosphate isomerase/epimerase